MDGVDAVNVNVNVSPWRSWVETFVLTAVAVVVSYVTGPQDPFRLTQGFPWPMLGPLLAGLRYGFAHGFVSALLVLAALGVAINQQLQIAEEFPLPWAIGVVVVAMVAGEFRDVWERRLRRLAGTNQYRAERLEEFTRSYQLLRLSHDRLEQTVANSGLSLREGILRLQSTLHAIDGLTPESLQKLLALLVEYGSLERAAIYPIKNNRLALDTPLATYGAEFTLETDDPIVRAALDNGELAAVNMISAPVAEQSGLLLALPMVDAAGEIHAMLVVKSMPFFAFHESSLKLLAVLAAHGIDHLLYGSATTSVARFIKAFDRVRRDQKVFKQPAMLIKFSGEHEPVSKAFETIKAHIRALDMVCITRENNHVVVWLLLPLTDTLGARNWLQRESANLPAGLDSELIEVGDIDPAVIHQLESH
ncbi:PelD-like GGDEF domain-containing protein [Permianibacter aggregans]|uniref:PelD-like GGDEF domain-containing protein n=2 Tax=Permianibacter aggregans TaxID=1510150 RepID=A0A4R6UTF3_9GAMM|nr:PelD-like GGDEF domain-containing protein [Permianibacter aggregans]